MAKHVSSSVKITESSLFLMASTGLTAGLGFLFWIIVDRSYSPERVGLATSLINAISLISYLSLFGLNSVLIRFQAAPRARNSQVTRALLISSGGGLLFGGGFLVLLPWISPELEFVRTDPWYALLFVSFCGFAAVNLLTDSVFMAARLPHYNMLVDGVIQSLSKLAMPIFLVTFGTVGIVASTGIGYAVAVIASLTAMCWRLGFRFDMRTKGTRLREHAKYSLANYGSALLNLIPQLALPMIALQKLGSEAEAYYFMAFQVANILYTASHSIGDATFAEASHDVSRLGECLRRSAKLNLLVGVPAVLVVSLGAGLLLRLFGDSYADNAQALLVLLAIGAFAVALNNWSSNALRIVGRIRPLVSSNIVYALASIGMAEATAGRGLLWIGWAWVAGNLLSGLIAVVYLPRGARRPAPTGSAAVPEAAPEKQAVAGWTDETQPLSLPWVVRDVRRPGRTLPERPNADSGADTIVGLRGFGGDIAIRARPRLPEQPKTRRPESGQSASERPEQHW
ncbi:MAG TPA: lipopolysaccharide biosynthesis protein [Actinospica sp.]|nr:lipopolysaccharide biosynthesis protein [Actinospica sp.]